MSAWVGTLFIFRHITTHRRLNPISYELQDCIYVNRRALVTGKIILINV